MKNKIGLILRLITAGILVQTLYFKFTGAAESKYIFGTLGVEPVGRWFAGVSELIASILLLIPQTQIFGALMTIGVMAGAILSHIFVIGISVLGDGGLLFSLACVVSATSFGILFLKKDEIMRLIKRK